MKIKLLNNVGRLSRFSHTPVVLNFPCLPPRRKHWGFLPAPFINCWLLLRRRVKHPWCSASVSYYGLSLWFSMYSKCDNSKPPVHISCAPTARSCSSLITIDLSWFSVSETRFRWSSDNCCVRESNKYHVGLGISWELIAMS